MRGTPNYETSASLVLVTVLLIFFHHYWGSGEPGKRNGYVYSFHGSLPGTPSVIRRRTNGINFAILFNERGKIGNGEVDRRINSIVDEISDWSTELDKDNYEFRYETENTAE